MLPLADVRYNEEGELSVKETVASSGVIMARAYQQLRLEISNMVKFDPDVVLSDSVLSTVLAARIVGKRVITVLNQLKIESSQRESVPHRLLSAGTSEGLGTLWGLSEKILLPDLPPPLTLSENNLWNANVDNTKYIGFLTPQDEGAPDEAHRSFVESRHPRIFWQVSGPPKTRSPFLRKAFEISDALSDIYSFVLTGGDPAGSTEPRAIPGGWYYGWCTLVPCYFKDCDIVVSRAGHGTLAQSISNGKPSLLVPIPGQTEQEGNSGKAMKLGVALTVSQEELTLAKFKETVELLMGGDFASNCSKIGAVARGFEARREILSALTEGA
jgi:UDP:flavonoid glycosyltransferase YjiC (YdhE family)